MNSFSGDEAAQPGGVAVESQASYLGKIVPIPQPTSASMLAARRPYRPTITLPAAFWTKLGFARGVLDALKSSVDAPSDGPIKKAIECLDDVELDLNNAARFETTV